MYIGSTDPKKSKRVKFNKRGKEDLGLFFSSDFYRNDSSAGVSCCSQDENIPVLLGTLAS